MFPPSVLPYISTKVWATCAVIIPLFTTIAVTEAFQGQLIIALIAALPPTGAVVVALVALKRGQAEMKVALDGKLDALMSAKESVARSAGAQQERVETRERADVDAAKPQTPMPVVVVGEVSPMPDPTNPRAK